MVWSRQNVERLVTTTVTTVGVLKAGSTGISACVWGTDANFTTRIADNYFRTQRINSFARFNSITIGYWDFFAGEDASTVQGGQIIATTDGIGEFYYSLSPSNPATKIEFLLTPRGSGEQMRSVFRFCGDDSFALGKVNSRVRFTSSPTGLTLDQEAGTYYSPSAPTLTKAQLTCGGIDSQTGIFKAPPYTFSTRPSASANAGGTIRITDRSNRLATSDGTNWNWAGTTTAVS